MFIKWLGARRIGLSRRDEKHMAVILTNTITLTTGHTFVFHDLTVASLAQRVSDALPCKLFSVIFTIVAKCRIQDSKKEMVQQCLHCLNAVESVPIVRILVIKIIRRISCFLTVIEVQICK